MNSRFRILLIVGLGSLQLLIFFLRWSATARNDPWYHNLDMDSQTIASALDLNSNQAPGGIDQPALFTNYFLALTYRVEAAQRRLSIWSLPTLAASPDPISGLGAESSAIARSA